jgi:hypothetical protein
MVAVARSNRGAVCSDSTNALWILHIYEDGGVRVCDLYHLR